MNSPLKVHIPTYRTARTANRLPLHSVDLWESRTDATQRWPRPWQRGASLATPWQHQRL